MARSISSFLAFASRPDDLAVLKTFAQAKGFAEEAVQQGEISSATEYLKTNPSPDVLVVELPSQQAAPALLEALSQVCDPATKVIAIGTINEFSFYTWLMDIGITQYLLCPLTEQALDGAFAKMQGIFTENAKNRPPSKLIAVMGARGGVGATTVSINLASIIAERTQKKVALVDLDAQEGTVSLALDVQPSLGLRDALEKPDRIDSMFLERVMSKMGKYLSILSAEEGLSEQLAIHEHAAEPLLTELRNKYDYVVLDVPRHMNHFTRTCLTTADHTILVTELSLLCLRDTLRMQDAMQGGWKAKPPLLLANRVGLAPKQEVPQPDFEKGVNAKIAQRIPFAADIFMPLSRDVAAIKNKNHASVKPLYAFAASILPELAPVQEEKKSGGFSLLKKKKD